MCVYDSYCSNKHTHSIGPFLFSSYGQPSTTCPGWRRVPRALGTCAANRVLRARRAGLSRRRGGLPHVHHAVGGGGLQVQRRERGTGGDHLSPPVGKNSEKSVAPLYKYINADFWEILSEQDVTRRRHQLAVAVCRGERDAVPAAHTSPDRVCTFSQVLSTVTLS